MGRTTIKLRPTITPKDLLIAEALSCLSDKGRLLNLLNTLKRTPSSEIPDSSWEVSSNLLFSYFDRNSIWGKPLLVYSLRLGSRVKGPGFSEVISDLHSIYSFIPEFGVLLILDLYRSFFNAETPQTTLSKVSKFLDKVSNMGEIGEQVVEQFIQLLPRREFRVGSYTIYSRFNCKIRIVDSRGPSHFTFSRLNRGAIKLLSHFLSQFENDVKKFIIEGKLGGY